MSEDEAARDTVVEGEPRFAILYDTELRRPACVLLQAVAGGDRAAFQRYFGGAEDWLTFPTPGMKLIHGTDAEWRRVSRYPTR